MQKNTESVHEMVSSSNEPTSVAKAAKSSYQGVSTNPSNTTDSKSLSIYGGKNGSMIPDPTNADTAIWSPPVQTLLDQPPSTLPQKLLLGGMAFSLAFGIWATVGKIEQVGYAKGQLVPQGEVYKIHPVESAKGGPAKREFNGVKIKPWKK